MEYASYATTPDSTRGRLYPEAECTTRSCFQRDRDRIIHSAAFRRLEYKTQVFVNHEGDHYRTRLTHSLEVSQLTRSICRILRLNEDLGEALALAHDLGHTPFGHAGEYALDEVMHPYGGFDHNAQTIRILTQMETKYANFDGLNLSWETLEGIAKHNGPVTEPPRALAAYQARHDLELHSHAGPEAQIAALADDIAYNNHDMEDGLRAGMFALEDMAALPLMAEIIDKVTGEHPDLPRRRASHEVIRRMINRMVNDLIEQTRRHIETTQVKSAADVRALSHPVAEFSEEMQAVNREIKRFLMERMYRHYKVNRMTTKACRVVKELFLFFMDEPGCLPTHWQQAMVEMDEQRKAELVCDFIAGMTDRFALEEHVRIFEVAARS